MKGYLHLQSGEVFEGDLLTSATKKIIKGDIVFYTGMTGYQEALVSPSYEDKIIVFTYPLVGSYGINQRDYMTKKPLVAGVIVYEAIMEKHHYTADYTLAQYLQKWDVPLLGHIDTRTVVKRIRSIDIPIAVLGTDVLDNAGLSEESGKAAHDLNAYRKEKKHMTNEHNRSAIAYA